MNKKTKRKNPARSAVATPTSSALRPPTWPPEDVCGEHSELARRYILETIDSLDKHQIQNLATFALILRNNQGQISTPVESGIDDIVFHYAINASRDYAMTLDDIVERINGPDGVRSYWDDALAFAKRNRKHLDRLLEWADAKGAAPDDDRARAA